MAYQKERANEVYDTFCDELLFRYLHCGLGTDSANQQIAEKRKLLESRWGVNLPIRLITE